MQGVGKFNGTEPVVSVSRAHSMCADYTHCDAIALAHIHTIKHFHTIKSSYTVSHEQTIAFITWYHPIKRTKRLDAHLISHTITPSNDTYHHKVARSHAHTFTLSHTQSKHQTTKRSRSHATIKYKGGT